MKFVIPDLEEIVKARWAHRVGYSFQGNKEVKLKILEQGTTPRDKNLLKKLGLKDGEKILAIASYYASWASELKKAGVKVDYSDVSKPIVKWVKKNSEVKFDKYVNLLQVKYGYTYDQAKKEVGKRVEEYETQSR